MSDRLKGKSIIITGGESGIGRAIALRCLDEGASVVISGISEEDMESTYSEAIKKIWEIHKWIFHKTWWNIIFFMPYVIAEVLIIYLIVSFIGSLLFGSTEPMMPLTIENDYQWVK